MSVLPESLRRVLAAKGLGQKTGQPSGQAVGHVAGYELPFDSERTTVFRSGEVVREIRGKTFQRRSVAPIL